MSSKKRDRRGRTGGYLRKSFLHESSREKTLRERKEGEEATKRKFNESKMGNLCRTLTVVRRERRRKISSFLTQRKGD